MIAGINICICTFRRPHVAETLRSLARMQRKPDWVLNIIIADNDEIPSAKAIVESTAKETGLPVTYLHAPAFNISIARNACLNAATAPLVAFIDDDELVTENWLERMLSKIESSKADVVLGPVRAIYRDEYPQWIKKGDFHSTSPVFASDNIVTGYSCNVIFRRLSPALKDLRFRTELGRSGGEDTAFFSAVYTAGGFIAYAEEAIVTEEVTPERAKLLWLLKRRFRAGQTHGFLLLEADNSFSARIKDMAKVTAKLIFCLCAALLHLACFSRLVYWLLRGALHLGALSKLLGVREVEQYGKRN